MGQQGDIFYVGEGLELVGRRLALRRRDELPQRRKSAGVEPAAGHAPAAHARPLHHAGAQGAEESARDWLRRRRHGGRGQHRPERRDAHHRGDRAARPARRLRAFRRAQFPRRPEPEDAGRHRRCAAFPADDRRAVRRDYVRSARSVGEGRGDALHEGVLRAREIEAEPGRHRHAVRAALRKHAGSGEERDRHLLRGVSQTASSGGTRTRGADTTPC